MPRLMDLILALSGLLISLPIFLFVCLLVRWKLGAPIFYQQKRAGLDGKLFMIYKFRSMTNECDADGNLLSDEHRMTPFGRFLRNSSLDELPCLINVVRGDMALVGPRPLMAEYLELYNDTEMRRHEVKPGITGWAQVNGRNKLSWSEKFAMDVWYVDHKTFWLDLKILFFTVPKVFMMHGVSADNEVTMSRFTGSHTK